jgi:SAM-dependent methyltransferase
MIRGQRAWRARGAKVFEKQVDKAHYGFKGYVSKARWASYWHQLDEVLGLAPQTVLEIGPGPGLFKTLAARFGVAVETMDLDPDLRPDHVASILDMPFPDGRYDVVCAFQVLEHLPYARALRAFAEMVRVARRHVVISLPDARRVWRYVVHVPAVGPIERLVRRPQLEAPAHEFDGEHHWEINKRGFELEKVAADLSTHAKLLRNYRVRENPYHRFLAFEKRPASAP